ncbi:MAG: sigma-70 family RNA polymerase sigma factor [Terracidiphilus sp.]
MEDALPAFVLHSEAVHTEAMSDVPANSIEDSDERLMLAFARGANGAFTTLFDRYRQPIFGFFRRRVADPAHAEELAQETFLAVLLGASRYQASALFRTWLYAIAFKILRTHRRKAAFRATFLGAPAEIPEPAAAGSLDVEVMMRQAVRALDAMDREVLLLREFEQLSYAEIASLLDLPLNTVRSRLFRARMALHALLAPTAANVKEAL